jgi:hypothetical protein
MKIFTRSLFILIVLTPLCAVAESSWPLPLLTGGASEAQVTIADWTALRRDARHPLPTGWEGRLGVVSEDTLRLTDGDKTTNLSAVGWEGALRGDDPALGHLYYRTGMREVSITFRDGMEVNSLLLDMRSHALLLATPERNGWRIGVEVTDLEADGGGVASGLSGVIGDAAVPTMSVNLAQSALLIQAERRIGSGGMFLAAGNTEDRMTLSLTDTHTQQAPMTYDGHRYRYGGWVALGTGTLELTMVSGNADGDDQLTYDGSENGRMTGSQHLRQGVLSYTNARARYTLGYADFTQRRRGFGVKPNTNGFTVLANGECLLESRFGEIRHRWELPRARALAITYQLHRLHLNATGAYRAGFIGGLLETERGNGAATEHAWLHYLALDTSARIAKGRLGYLGQITVPLVDDEDDSLPTSPSTRGKTRGGFAHTLYWEQRFD